jgi:hypothetical protein
LNNYESTFESITGLAAQVEALNQRAVRQYASVVEEIVRSGSRDASWMEHTLDGLLDFCGCDSALALFKKLCRHYWTIDPVATAEYVNAYRQTWDKESGE